MPGTSSTPPTMIRLGSPSAWASTQWMTLAVRIRGTLPGMSGLGEDRGRHRGRIGDRPRDGAPVRGRGSDGDRRRPRPRSRARDLRRPARTPTGRAGRRHGPRGRRGARQAASTGSTSTSTTPASRRRSSRSPRSPARSGTRCRRQPHGAVRRRPGRRAEAQGRRAARHRLDHRQPPAPRPVCLRRVQDGVSVSPARSRSSSRPTSASTSSTPAPPTRRCSAASASTSTPHRRSRSSA